MDIEEHELARLLQHHGKALGNSRIAVLPSDEQLRLLIDSVHDYAIFLLDANGYVISWNTGAQRIKGYTEEEVIGKHFSIFYTPEDIECGHPQIALGIAATNGRYEEEGWRVRKNGSVFWVYVVITAIRDEAGNICGYGKVTRDFTERRATQERLFKAQENFRLLVDGAKDFAIFMLDIDGNITTWNEGAERLKGYKAPEIIGKHFSVFYTPKDIARNHPLHELQQATMEGSFEEEGWRVRKDGSAFWAYVVITALKDEHGVHYGFAKVTRDFTDRKNAENERLESVRDRVSRKFLRDILFVVTEGKLRLCEKGTQLPSRYTLFKRSTKFDENRLFQLRGMVREAATQAGLADDRFHDLMTAVGEAAMNAVVHADFPRIAIYTKEGTVQVWIRDRGQGISLSSLPLATLERGYSTSNSLGYGFWLMLRSCDRLWLYTSSSGTIVVVEKDASAPQLQSFESIRASAELA